MAFESELGYWRLQSHSDDGDVPYNPRVSVNVNAANVAEFDITTSFLRFLCN
uniref:Uncharacterized protein n=1 Tax=Brassica campestris TaxID=3711 RepID=A0A3P5ZCX8_BRACM|nr:unnamed protein product [Brassica rapa]